MKKLIEALTECQRALATLTSPDAIRQTSLAQSWAMAVAAEAKAREALSSLGKGQ